jgi:hypothetical protein
MHNFPSGLSQQRLCKALVALRASSPTCVRKWNTLSLFHHPRALTLHPCRLSSSRSCMQSTAVWKVKFPHASFVISFPLFFTRNSANGSFDLDGLSILFVVVVVSLVFAALVSLLHSPLFAP